MSKGLGSINITHGVACDDIRQEVNGKYILIGVYSGNLGLPVFPAPIALGFWVLARPSHVGDYDVQLRVLGPDGKEVSRGQMNVRVHAVEDTALVIPPLPILLAKPGGISLQYREGDGSWRTVCALDARPTPLATPPA
jgi:hypothetical protein